MGHMFTLEKVKTSQMQAKHLCQVCTYDEQQLTVQKSSINRTTTIT